MSELDGSARSWAPEMPHSGGAPAYGAQSSQAWAAGETDERPILDLVRNGALWRVTVLGENLIVRIVYGTLATREITDRTTPLLIWVPGQCCVYARPADPELPANVRVTATQATAGGRGASRRLVTDGHVFSPDASSYFALTASALVVRGVAVAVGAMEECPLIEGSTLTTGDGYEESAP